MATAFALCGGILVKSVHPSLDEALAKASKAGFTPKRVGRNSAVLKERTPWEPDGDNGGFYITQITLEPSQLHDGMWCQKNCEDESGAFNYFPEEDWMQ